MEGAIFEFSNDVKCINSDWLRGELSIIRASLSESAGDFISDDPWTRWRKIAGVTRKDGTLSRSRFLTKRQAALLIFLALYKPGGQRGIQTLLGEKTKAGQIGSTNIRPLFNRWAATGFDLAKDLIDVIQKTPETITEKDLATIAPKLAGEEVTLAQIRRWLGGKVEGALKTRQVWKVLHQLEKIAIDNDCCEQRSA